MTTINTILFDLGGVLIDWNPRYVYREYWQNDESKIDYFLENICTGDWNVQMDAGRPFSDCVAELKEHTDESWHEAIEMWQSHWPKMLGRDIRTTVNLLYALKTQNKYDLYALTNWSAETFPIARERFSFLNECFKDIFVSGEIFMKKPDRDIFEYALAKMNKKPQEVVFIDDSLHNVKAARALGMYAVHFTTTGAVVAELRALGLNLPA